MMTTKEIVQRHDTRSVFDVLLDVTRDDDLMKRLATIRDVVRGGIVFTTSFGIEDQAIGHAIFVQDLEIDVVTFDTGRLFQETYEFVVADGMPLRQANPGILSRPREC